MNDIIKDIIAGTLLACAAVIIIGVVATPIILAVKISLYWLFLYLAYLVIILAGVIWFGVEFGYPDKKSMQEKDKRQ